MKLFSKKEKKAPAVKQATVEVDAEYYTHLLCKEYLIEAIAKVVYHRYGADQVAIQKRQSDFSGSKLLKRNYTTGKSKL